MILFHGTTKEAAEKILKNGFKFGDCSDFGKAVYFSPNREWAEVYALKDGVIIEVSFNGIILDLQVPRAFELYKNIDCRFIHTELTQLGYDALKDNNIVAIYRTGKIKIIK